jgi:uncharacterized membrane protein SpoIIM required for sporulation
MMVPAAAPVPGSGTLAGAVARLEELVERGRRHPRALARADLRDLPIVYRRAITALAEARARDVPIAQLARLERVLIAAHGLLYAPEPPRLGRAFAALLREIPEVVKRSGRALALAIGICALGGLWGYAVIRADPARAIALLSPELIENARNFKGGPTRAGDPLYGVFYFTNNAKVALTVYALGASFGLGTVVILLYNGIVLGGTLALVLSAGASSRFFSFVLAHGGIEMLAIFIAAAAGLEMGYAMLRPGWKRRGDALRDAAHATLPMALGAALLLSVAGLVEGWISPKPLAIATKALIGGSLLGAALLYLILGGRAHRRATGRAVLADGV